MLSTQLDDADGELLGVERRVLLRHAAGDDVDIRGRLLERDAGLELRLKHEELALERRIAAVQHDRPLEIRRQLREPRRHDPDERRRHAVERERPADDRRDRG